MPTNNETTVLTKDPDAVVGRKNKPKTFWTKMKDYIRKDLLMFAIVVGIVIGFAVGFGVRELHPSKDTLMWMGMPGELFLRVLRCMVLPLIVCSVIAGTSSLDPKSNGKISLTAFLYIVFTNTVGSGIGVVLSVLIQPGVGTEGTSQSHTKDSMETQDIFADLLRNIMPDNMVEAAFKQAQTQYSKEIISEARNATDGTLIDAVYSISKSLGKVDSVNVLGLIFIGTIMGVAAAAIKDKTRSFLEFFSGSTEIVLVIMRAFFWFAPLGIGSLIAVAIAGITNMAETFSQLGLLVLTVTIGISIHSFVFLPLILFALTRKNPFAFFVTIIRPLLVGFATTSTAVVIPEMLNSCEEKNGMDPRVTRFVIPFCATLNRDGSAIYITASAVFVGQMMFGSVSVSNAVVIWILTSVAAMAIPPVPSASIVTLIIILTSLSIPTNGITLLFAVEWFLDRLRTDCNIVSHTFCAAVTYHFCKKDLHELDQRRSHEEVEVL